MYEIKVQNKNEIGHCVLSTSYKYGEIGLLIQKNNTGIM